MSGHLKSSKWKWNKKKTGNKNWKQRMGKWKCNPLISCHYPGKICVLLAFCSYTSQISPAFNISSQVTFPGLHLVFLHLKIGPGYKAVICFECQ